MKFTKEQLDELAIEVEALHRVLTNREVDSSRWWKFLHRRIANVANFTGNRESIISDVMKELRSVSNGCEDLLEEIDEILHKYKNPPMIVP